MFLQKNALAFVTFTSISHTTFFSTHSLSHKSVLPLSHTSSICNQSLHSHSLTTRVHPHAQASDATPSPRLIETPTPASLPAKSVAVVWLRNDLRVRDHAAFALANTADRVVPIYVFDKALYGIKNASPWRFQRVGPFRAAFLVEAIKDMRNSLRIRGSDIAIRMGDPVAEVLDIVRTLLDADFGPVTVLAGKELAWEEVQAERRLEKGLKTLSEHVDKQVNVHWLWDSTLHHLNDLPFNPADVNVPHSFAAYQKLMEATEDLCVREEISLPERFNPFPLELALSSNTTPSLANELKVKGLCEPHDYPFPDPRGVLDFEGGQTHGEERLQQFFWFSPRPLETYHETKNRPGERNCTSKFSPWLSLGCLSPRMVYWECKKFQDKFSATESTNALISELMRRDYCRWLAASMSTRLFALNGAASRSVDNPPVWKKPSSASLKRMHRDRLKLWVEGNTGAPIVDASMRELAATGYTSNLGRQCAASFLIHELQFPDWRAGAEYFESVLIDYDAASNWANWARLAGLGVDSHGVEKLNVVSQGQEHDPKGWFIIGWCPELLEIPPPMIHEPHTLSVLELEDFEVVLGDTYPEPIVPLEPSTYEVEDDEVDEDFEDY